MLKLMWVDGKPMWIPVTEQEDAEHVAMLEAVRNIPESKPVVHHFGYCADERDAMPGRHAKAEFSPETGGYDYLYAELCRDHDAEKAKVRNRRKADRKHPENKAERKKEKQNRMHRLYGLAYEDTKYGKTVYFWDKKEGQKKFPEYEAEIFRNLKERSAEKSARAEEPAEYRVGWSEIDRMMYNADKIMREIRANIAEIPGAETHDEYWKDMNGEILFYEDEYYYRKAEWNYCYHKKIKGQKPDYADMCAMWEQIANTELHDWLKYA